MDQRIIEKFWERVEKQENGCWLWTGQLSGSTPWYHSRDSSLTFNGKIISLKLAGINTETMNVVSINSICKNKRCVNPDHLISDDEHRFWSKVEHTEECWNWLCSGDFSKQINGKLIRISPNRQSYEMAFGPIPDNTVVHQTCNNNSCVRPEHLTLRSRSDVSKSIERPATSDHIEKFWASIEKTKFCWNWTGFLDKKGSPIIRMSNGIQNGKKSLKEYSARRLSLTLTGKELDPESHVIPWCRNQICVRPDHLAHGDEARFWNHTYKTGEDECWPWIGAHDKNGYGKFRIVEKGKNIDIRAHIYSWQIHNGNQKVRTDIGMLIMHSCDHPYCVNPNHLSLGTHKENARDREQKGRGRHGEKSANKRKIRELLEHSDYTEQQLSDLFESQK
jgi:hypothetical protein